MCWIKEFIEIYGSKILPFTSSILKASLASNSSNDSESQMRKYFNASIYLKITNIIIIIKIINYCKLF